MRDPWFSIIFMLCLAIVTALVTWFGTVPKENRRAAYRNIARRFRGRRCVVVIPSLIILLSAVSGCTAERAFLIPPSVPVQLAVELKDVPVWVKTKEGPLVKATADLYPGLWIVLDPQDWSTEERAEAMHLERTDDE